jgi:hypothetical protein
MDSINDDSDFGLPTVSNRFRARDTGDGHVEIYDSENEDAWIRSDLTLDVGRPY